MMLLKEGGRDRENGYGVGVGRRTPSTGARKSYEMNLLPLSAEHRQRLFRPALLGHRVSPKKSLVTAEKSVATLEPAGAINLGKLLLHFHSFFLDFVFICGYKAKPRVYLWVYITSKHKLWDH